MTRTQWQDTLHARLAQAARFDPMKCANHPAYRALMAKIEDLIQFGLHREWITPEEASTL